MLLWNSNYPGIYIDPRSFDAETLVTSPLGVSQGGAFQSAARNCLAKIASKPVGRDLLALISKRCRGIGTKVRNGHCRIMFGPGTYANRPGGSIGMAIEQTFAGPSVDFSLAEDLIVAQMARTKRSRIKVHGRYMTVAGAGLPAFVSFNPFTNLDAEMRAHIGVPTPAFVALAHELVHALHTLSGDSVPHADGDTETMIEEARTVGAGKYLNTRISENAVRREHGIAIRTFYDRPGDCDAGALA